METNNLDYCEITINILTMKGFIMTDKFTFLDIRTCPIDPLETFLEFENIPNNKMELVEYDLSRYCEMEILKHKWLKIERLEGHKVIIDKLRFLFEPYLKIEKVVYDDIGYLLFKIYMRAVCEGRFYCLLYRKFGFE